MVTLLRSVFQGRQASVWFSITVAEWDLDAHQSHFRIQGIKALELVKGVVRLRTREESWKGLYPRCLNEEPVSEFDQNADIS